MLSQHHCLFDVKLDDNVMVQQFLSMTPFFFRGAKARREALLAQPQLNTQADMLVSVYRPRLILKRAKVAGDASA